MAKIKKLNWYVQKGYSIEDTLEYHGLGFEGFEIIEKATKNSLKVKKKIIADLCKDLRRELLEEYDFNPAADISKVKNGVYIIALGGPFELQYEKKPSRVLYIGSGSVYSRVRNHLSGKLFDFAESIPNMKLRFFFADLGDGKNSHDKCRFLEQRLLEKFKDETDDSLPLLNKINSRLSKDETYTLPTGWDKPLHADRGKSVVEWRLIPSNFDKWKGSL